MEQVSRTMGFKIPKPTKGQS